MAILWPDREPDTLPDTLAGETRLTADRRRLRRLPRRPVDGRPARVERAWEELARQQEDLRWGWRGLWLGYALLLAGCLLLAATVRDGEARLRQARPSVRSAR